MCSKIWWNLAGIVAVAAVLLLGERTTWAAELVEEGAAVAAAPAYAETEAPAEGAGVTEGAEVAGVTGVPGVYKAQAAPDVQGLIVDAAARWGLPAERMLRVAWCESRWEPGARGGGGHMGVFQFSAGTWAWASEAAGYAGASPYEAAANVEAAAWLMSTGEFGHWGCR